MMIRHVRLENIVLKTLFFLALTTSLSAIEPTTLTTAPQPDTQKSPEASTSPQLEPIEKIKAPIPTKMVGSKQEIHVGCSLPLTGEVSILSNQVFDGMTLFFNKILKEAPELTFSCALKVLDDANQIPKLNTNVTTMLKESPLLISPYGTDALSSLMPRITSQQALVLFPLEGSTAFRKPEFSNLIFFRASFAQEIQALIDYTVQTLGKKKIALFYEASEWGEGVLEDTKQALKIHNLTLMGAASYPQNSLNITQGAEALVQKAPNAILCIAGARPAYNFIRHIINKGLHQTVFLGLTSLISIQSTLAKSRGVNIIASSVVPDPINSTTKIAQEYRADMKKYFSNKPLTPFSLEGYINAALLVEVLKLTKFPLTTEKIVEIFTHLKHVKFKDLELKFNPSTRSLCNAVWLNLGDGKDWVLAKEAKANGSRVPERPQDDKGLTKSTDKQEST